MYAFSYSLTQADSNPLHTSKGCFSAAYFVRSPIYFATLSLPLVVVEFFQSVNVVWCCG